MKCELCKNATDIGEGNFICLKMFNRFSVPIQPVEDWERTENYMMCEGEDYERYNCE